MHLVRHQKELLGFITEIEFTMSVPQHTNVIDTVGFCITPCVLFQELAWISLEKFVEEVNMNRRPATVAWMVGRLVRYVKEWTSA